MSLLNTNEQWQTNNRREVLQINDRQVTNDARQIADNYGWTAHIQQSNYWKIMDKQVMNNIQLNDDQ